MARDGWRSVVCGSMPVDLYMSRKQEMPYTARWKLQDSDTSVQDFWVSAQHT